MKTLFEIIKELFAVVTLVLGLGLIGKLFLKHTLVGKIIAVTLKELFLFLRGCFRLIKSAIKMIIKTGKATTKFVNKHNKKHVEKKITKQAEKKVINGSPVIQINSARELRHKWTK